MIARVGIELEGGFRRSRGLPLHHDASVHVSGPVAGPGWISAGELISSPMTPAGLCAWLPAHMPDAVNSSCGCHVHASVGDRLEYQALMGKGFYDSFKAAAYRLTEGEALSRATATALRNRLRGGSHYAADSYQPDAQAAATHKSGVRYAFVNYCYGLHGTFEARVFPGTTVAAEAVAFVSCVVATADRWLLDMGFGPGDAAAAGPAVTLYVGELQRPGSTAWEQVTAGRSQGPVYHLLRRRSGLTVRPSVVRPVYGVDGTGYRIRRVTGPAVAAAAIAAGPRKTEILDFEGAAEAPDVPAADVATLAFEGV